MAEPVVELRDLTVRYKTKASEITALDHINLAIGEREIVAVVGESGCGKSTLGMSIINLLRTPPAVIDSGEILFRGDNILALKDSEMARVRGTGIAMIFQEPLSSLDPVRRVGDQVSEAIRVREGRVSRKDYGPYNKTDGRLRQGTEGGVKRLLGVQLPPSQRPAVYNAEATAALSRVQISDPARVLQKYPHELSGGMAQRVMIAQALIEKPSFLIADEPTSALDVTTQAQVLNLIRELRDELGSSILFITHDLAVAAQIADRIVVMYAGELVELGGIADVYAGPKHPYSEGLIRSFPDKYKDEGRLDAIPGSIPDLRALPPGCLFSPRCKYAFERCRVERPQLVDVGENWKAACFLRYQN